MAEDGLIRPDQTVSTSGKIRDLLSWRLISDAPQTGAVNMATDEAIAIAFSEGKAPPTLRFYRWSEPTVSIGAFQGLDPAWMEPFEEKTLSLVRRVTGGRALLHDAEITYSVIASTREPLFSSGIKGTFFSLSKGLLQGLEILGIDAAVYTPPRKDRAARQRDPLCFSASSWYEITAKRKKLIGSAQKRWSTYFLQQGSLMLGKSRMGLEKHHPMKAFISENQLALSDLLPVLPSHDQCVEAFRFGFESALGIRFIPGEITPYEQKIIQELIKKKYGNRYWNFYRGHLEHT